jgi:hypothetical protein
VENLCPQCGAPPEHFEPDVTQYTCHFCSTEYPVHHPKREAFLRAKREKEQEAEREQRAEEKRERKKAEARSEKVGAIIPVLTVGSIFAFAGAITYYEEYIKPNRWDGHSSFRCSKGSFTFTDIQATNKVDASGNCNVTLIRPQLESKIVASEHAIVTVTDGKVHYSGTAVDASGFAKVTLTGTTVDGKVSSTGSAVVISANAKILGKVTSDSAANLVGFPAPLPSATTTTALTVNPPTTSTWKPKPDFGPKACAGIGNCYKGYNGQIQGHLVVTVDTLGAVKNVSYIGTATADQKKCLTDLGNAKSFTPADGSLPGTPGQLICDYAGTVSSPGTLLMSTNGRFQPSK